MTIVTTAKCCHVCLIEQYECGSWCRPDVSVITANPKTAGVARWNFLALWGHKQSKGEEASLDFCKKVNVLEWAVGRSPAQSLRVHNPVTPITMC